MVLSGMPAAADLSAAWFRELEVVGSYASGRGPSSTAAAPSRSPRELVAGDAASQLAKTVASYPLHRWREALDHAHGAGRLGTVKVAFDARSEPWRSSRSRPNVEVASDARQQGASE